MFVHMNVDSNRQMISYYIFVWDNVYYMRCDFMEVHIWIIIWRLDNCLYLYVHINVDSHKLYDCP